ncbi:MAG: replication-relaxation family protein [Solirubrobacterales bacterium]
MAGRASSLSGRRTRAGSSAATPSLSDLDRRILDLLSFLRVLTQTQLARLMSPETPPRTVRYRTARLAKHGLVGRTRPYRERGSAPHHLWPTRKGEAIAEGGPPPRGGERREPNPLFLAHAAAISELYVVLSTEPPEGLGLAGFEREAEAREPFRGYDGKEHSVAPDAFIEIAEGDGRHLLGLVELDLGTMSTRQLKAKAEGYGEYVRLEGWQARHDFCPALLFLTTSDKRARSFLSTCHRSVDHRQMLVAACGLARDIGGSLTVADWRAGEDESGDLLAVLRSARRPYDEAREQEEAERRQRDAERDRLRSDPEALADRLRDELRHGWGKDRLGEAVTTALLLSVEDGGDLDAVARAAFAAVAGMLDEPLYVRLADREPTNSERRALDALVAQHRRDQLRRLDDLDARFGEGPKLYRRRVSLATGELLGRSNLDFLVADAERDRDGRAEQERHRDEYMSWREREAKRIAKAHRVIERRRIGRDAFLEQVDRAALRRCSGCEEIAYPNPERASGHSKRHVAERCHYCGGYVSGEIDPDEGPA